MAEYAVLASCVCTSGGGNITASYSYTPEGPLQGEPLQYYFALYTASGNRVGALQPVSSFGGDASFSAVADGNYEVRVLADPDGAAVATALVSVACTYIPDPDPDPDPDPTDPEPVRGCRDPRATNYNSAATEEDGSCEYAPTERIPFFQVPLLNALRFVQPESPDTCTRFETADNTLFCAQTRPGQQMRPRYRQKVQRCDQLTVQVLTDFTALTATVRKPGATQTLASFVGTRKQRHTGEADPLAVTLSAGAGGLTQLVAAEGTLPETLRRAQRVRLSGPAAGTWQVKQSGRTSTGAAYLLLSRPWAAVAEPVQATWQLTGVGFDVWEVSLGWAGLSDGEYEVVLRATDPTQPPAVAVSEPLLLADTHANTVLIEYQNKDNAYGMVFTTGLYPRLRVGGTFFKLKPSGTSQQHRSSSGAPTLLSSTAQRGIVLETFELPDWLHEKLFVALRLDGVRINGQPVLGSGDYEWSALASYPLSSGTATMELKRGLGAGNGDDNGLPTTPSENDLLLLSTNRYLRLR